MKKIVLLIVVIVSFSCSKSEDEVINYTPRELIGSWKLVGTFDCIENPNTSDGFDPVIDGSVTTFLSDNNFNTLYLNNNYSGIYTVFQDSTIRFIHNNTQDNIKNKFLIVSDSILMLGPPEEYALGTVSKFKKVSE